MNFKLLPFFIFLAQNFIDRFEWDEFEIKQDKSKIRART